MAVPGTRSQEQRAIVWPLPCPPLKPQAAGRRAEVWVQTPCEALQGLRPQVLYGVSPEESKNLRINCGYTKSERTIHSVFHFASETQGGLLQPVIRKRIAKMIEAVTEGKQLISG